MNRFSSYFAIMLAYLIGGGALLLFVAFLVAGPFSFIHFDVSQTQALLWDTFLSMLFFVQHSVMVRQSFRARLSYAVRPHYHAATYAIVSGIVLAAVVMLWQTTQTVLYEVQGPLQWAFRSFALLAVAGLVLVARTLKSFDLFGRISITDRLHGKQPSPSQFYLSGPYFWVRHPLYFFLLVLIWASPVMNSDRLVFNLLWTCWVIYGTHLEEKDLVAVFGDTYSRYQKVVPMLLPWRGPVGKSLAGS